MTKDSGGRKPISEGHRPIQTNGYRPSSGTAQGGHVPTTSGGGSSKPPTEGSGSKK